MDNIDFFKNNFSFFKNNFRNKTLKYFWKIADNCPHKAIKIRLFNKFFLPPFEYSYSYFNKHILLWQGNEFSYLALSYPRKDWDNDCFIWFHNKYNFPIIGFYETVNEVVLCSYPDLNSLKDSFIKSQDNTIMKLARLTGSDPMEAEYILESLMKYDTK